MKVIEMLHLIWYYFELGVIGVTAFVTGIIIGIIRGINDIINDIIIELYLITEIYKNCEQVPFWFEYYDDSKSYEKVMNELYYTLSLM